VRRTVSAIAELLVQLTLYVFSAAAH